MLIILAPMSSEDRKTKLDQLEEVIATGVERVKDGEREIKLRPFEELAKSYKFISPKKKSKAITPSFARGYHSESDDE